MVALVFQIVRRDALIWTYGVNKSFGSRKDVAKNIISGFVFLFFLL